MAAHWYTYAVPSWELELGEIEDEMDYEYRLEQLEERNLDNYELWLFDQKMLFYEDIAAVGGNFTKFTYHIPNTWVEDTWCTPKFNCYDPMGLFFRYVDTYTFNILMYDIFKMRGSAYRPWGNQHYDLRTLKTLFHFAERWCEIHVLYDEKSPQYNYKHTLWVVSRILIFLND